MGRSQSIRKAPARARRKPIAAGQASAGHSAVRHANSTGAPKRAAHHGDVTRIYLSEIGRTPC